MSDDQSRRQLEAICNNASVALFVMDARQHCTYMNPAAVELTGFTLEEVQGRPLHDFVHHTRPDGTHYPLDACPIDRAFPENNQEQGEDVFVHKDGHFYDVAFTASPLRENGETVGTVIEVQDISARKRTERVLRQTSEINAFRVELDSALRPLADPVEIQAVATQVLGEHLGASRVLYAEVSADGEHALIHADHCNGVMSIVGRHRLTDFWPVSIAEFRAGRALIVDDVAKDPRFSISQRGAAAALAMGAHVAVPLIKGGRAVALLAVNQSEARLWTRTEVALMEETAERTWAAVERAQAEAALRESEAKYRTLFESMNQGFGVAEVIFDTDDRPIDFRWLETNPAFARHTGLSDAVGKTARELVPGLEERWAEIYGRVAVTGEPHRFVEYAKTMDRWFEVEAFRLGAPERRRVAVLFTDVTERKNAEKTLQEANRRKDEFLAMLAHELRNPLGAIANTVKLLERHLPEAGIGRYLDILNHQTVMLRGVVSDLLDVSRITRGLVELRPERVDLVAVVDQALESVQRLLDEKEHEVSVTLPRKPLVVQGDPVRLEQILVNLLANAAKYTDPGGRIILGLERRGDQATLRVGDNGVGITSEVRERIFELFGQGERELARSEGGLGIGLTIVKSLVELHGGQIEVHSEGLNKGAEFVVTLPLTPAEEGVHPAVAPVRESAVRPKRVLLVEDNRDIAETLALLLEDSGHEVVLAHDGPSALAKAEETEPELILLDIGLPGLDGYEVARRLRQNPRTRTAVLAALTGYGQAEDIERARAAGFDRHFTKPVDIGALEAFVNEVQPQARQ